MSGAPGPVAITVASGSGVLVADWGRKMPVAVFCAPEPSAPIIRCTPAPNAAYRISLEPLNENTVEKGYHGLDGLERRLSSLQ